MVLDLNNFDIELDDHPHMLMNMPTNFPRKPNFHLLDMLPHHNRHEFPLNHLDIIDHHSMVMDYYKIDNGSYYRQHMYPRNNLSSLSNYPSHHPLDKESLYYIVELLRVNQDIENHQQ